MNDLIFDGERQWRKVPPEEWYNPRSPMLQLPIPEGHDVWGVIIRGHPFRACIDRRPYDRILADGMADEETLAGVLAKILRQHGKFAENEWENQWGPNGKGWQWVPKPDI